MSCGIDPRKSANRAPTGHATLGKVLNLTKLSLPPVCNEGNKGAYLVGLW